MVNKESRYLNSEWIKVKQKITIYDLCRFWNHYKFAYIMIVPEENWMENLDESHRISKTCYGYGYKLLSVYDNFSKRCKSYLGEDCLQFY